MNVLVAYATESEAEQVLDVVRLHVRPLDHRLFSGIARTLIGAATPS